MSLDLSEFLLILPVLALLWVAMASVFTWFGEKRQALWLARIRRKCANCGCIYRGGEKNRNSICPSCGTHHR